MSETLRAQMLEVLARHQRVTSEPGGPCWCDEWPRLSDGGRGQTWMEHVADALLAATAPTPDEVGQVEGRARVGTLAQLDERRSLWGTTLSFEEQADLHEAHERDSWRGEFTEVPTTVERILVERGATGSDA